MRTMRLMAKHVGSTIASGIRSLSGTHCHRLWLGIVVLSLGFISPVQAQQLRLAPGSWQLFSLPGDSNQSINALFAESFGGQVAGTLWSITVFDAQTQRYRALDGAEALQPGQGFWMKQIDDAPVSIPLPVRATPSVTASGACPSAAGCFSIPLPSGAEAQWSLIGSPFATALAFSDIRLQTTSGPCENGCSLAEAAQRGMTGGQIHAYDSVTGAYRTVSDGGLLQPGEGYWFPSLISDAAGAASLLLPMPDDGATDTVFAKAAQLGRGMNLGNALEAPSEGLWGLTLESYFFDRIADIGFDSVRVPIRWSAHAGNSAPYTIEPEFFERIDWVVAQGLRTGLAVVLNMHHYEDLMAAPAAERARYLALWRQIAERYANAPDSVFFELLNEPTEVFNEQPQQWNSLMAAAVDVVRQSNPQRALIVGPVGWNAIDRLPQLQLPDDDQLIATVHFYSPFAFTHQGATWVDPVPPIGTRFNPDTVVLGGGFEDWSWDTNWTQVAGGTRISFVRQYAGFNLRKLVPGQLRQMTLRINGAAELAVSCGDDGNFTQIDQILQTSQAVQNHVIDLSSCSAATGNLVLQNQTPAATSFVLEQGEVCTVSRCYAVFDSAGEALAAELQVAADWGSLNNLPVYVGEFGAYSEADMTSRAAWTRTVQSAIEELGMTSSYWEFGSGFGAFDVAGDSWIDPLLQALLLR